MTLTNKPFFRGFIITSIFGLFLSCQDHQLISQGETDGSTENNFDPETDYVEGLVRIKLSPDELQEFTTQAVGDASSCGIEHIDSIFRTIGVLNFKRTFRDAGKFEARTRKAGLHLWYDVTYDTATVEMSVAFQELGQLSEVEILETVQKVSVSDVVQKDIGRRILLSSSASRMSLNSDDDLPYNDEFLIDQWHYNNNGSVTDAIAGSDINLYGAWEIETGSPEVIVSIVDGGIDIDHEDLLQNIWVNESEDGGSARTDDDANGYEDDVNGYNFVSLSGSILGEDHGTHVAGTIGAVNNNKIGVCGIAGGTPTNPGVKLMSCQVFEVDDLGRETSASNFAEAIKYGADNGAVISQNSWGYDNVRSLPSSMQDAIDYFIEYAGFDENGVQVGPMAGGIVIFAAGNDETSTKAYPAMYEPILAVAACNPDFERSYYSNYGSWVDITATGGTYGYKGKYDDDCYVQSTANGDEYMGMAGTSMACPHVSGVAALIISKYGGEGFTPEMLKEKLFQGIVNIDQYNPNYIGELGVGLINAHAALVDPETTTPPAIVDDLMADVDLNTCLLSWSVSTDEEGIPADGFTIYYSRSEFNDDDVSLERDDILSIVVDDGSYDALELVSVTFDSLFFGSEYYFAVASNNLFGKSAGISSTVNIQTTENFAPIINAQTEGDIVLKSHEFYQFDVDIEEPNGERYVWSVDQTGAIDINQDGNTLEFTIEALDHLPGDYELTLTVTDHSGAATIYHLQYTILENNVPTASPEEINLYMGSIGQSTSVNLSEHIQDADGESLEFTIHSDYGLLTTSLSDDVLTIQSQSFGLSEIEIVATDARGTYCTFTIVVMMRSDEADIDIYPNPVSDVAYFRMGEGIDGEISVDVFNNSGVLVMQETAEISTFSPANMDFSELAAGMYSLKIVYGDQVMTRNIVKK